MTDIKPPDSLEELHSMTLALRRAVRGARQAALTAGPFAVECISHAYNVAGVSDSEALSIAGKSLRAVEAIRFHLAAVDQGLRLIAAETRKADTAVEEAQQRRAREARRLKI